MAYSGLDSFIRKLEKNDELRRIRTFVNPELEIAEITDRVTKSGGKALLFENTGTGFPLLINAYGSDNRMAMAIGRDNLTDAGKEIERLFEEISETRGTFFKRLSGIPSLIELTSILPERIKGKGICQQVIHSDPDLEILPVLKCWPYDGGRFLTLPVVHTRHPVTGKTNAGMYRMQVLDKNTTAIHWQRHKTGANHFEEWKRKGERMPVSVSLGGDPVYTYASTAPLPEGIDEYLLAGFLRKKRVRMVRCITNDLWVPCDADIIIEGYVDPAEELVWEGPFGDHTGFYSLADWYPKFHITCISHSRSAVYPATVVGIPPHEDAWLAKATEKIFLAPLKIALLPEIVDFHMPNAGTVHNLVIIRISKSYPGQGMKVLASLLGTGQMMFSKYLIVLSGETDIRNYREVAITVLENSDFSRDLLFCKGPLDVLDHSSDSFSFGGKLGIDATHKLPEETGERGNKIRENHLKATDKQNDFLRCGIIHDFNRELLKEGIPVLILTVDRAKDQDIIEKLKELFVINDHESIYRLIITVDHTVDPNNLQLVAWQLLGNSDPLRDHVYISASSLLIDGTTKAFRRGGFPRRWPNVVCSDKETIDSVDRKWESLGIGPFISSPSLIYGKLMFSGRDELEQ